MVQQQRLSYVLDLGYRAFKIEGLGQHNLEDLVVIPSSARKGTRVVAAAAVAEAEEEAEEAHLLHVDAVTGATKDQAGLHGARKFPGLLGDLLLVFAWKVDKVIVLGADQKGYCGLECPKRQFLSAPDPTQEVDRGPGAEGRWKERRGKENVENLVEAPCLTIPLLD